MQDTKVSRRRKIEDTATPNDQDSRQWNLPLLPSWSLNYASKSSAGTKACRYNRKSENEVLDLMMFHLCQTFLPLILLVEVNTPTIGQSLTDA